MTALEALIDRYAAGGTVLVYAVSGLTRAQGHADPGDGAGKWTIAELVAHLVDSDLVGGDRIKRVIAEPEPTLLAYDENAWVERLRSREMSVEEGVNLFTANRRWIATVLRGCADSDYARAGNHTERGRMTLAELITGYATHLDHHLRFLYAKRANLGAAVQPRYSYSTD
ncbi:MAG: DinB family protein [Isosphaeraceae bacterium]